MLHELTVCLGSGYWLNISFCWLKPEWQRQEETPPLIIPPSFPPFIPHPSLPPSLHLFIPHPLFITSSPPSVHPYIPSSIIHLSLSTSALLFLHPSSSFVHPPLHPSLTLLPSPPSSILSSAPSFLLHHRRSFHTSHLTSTHPALSHSSPPPLYSSPPALLSPPLPVCWAVLTSFFSSHRPSLVRLAAYGGLSR